MSDFEKELEILSQESAGEPEVKFPTMEEQKSVVEKLKKLEEEGKLTPEILEEHFGQFYQESDSPIH